MAIRMSGLQSGLDTESIVEQLMEAERLKKTKIENKKTKLEWKTEIWKGLNTKLTTFHTSWASKMRLQSSYKTKKAVSSDETKLTASAKVTAPGGTYDVKVNKLAASQYVTSGVMSAQEGSNAEGSKITANTKISDMMADGTFKEGSEITIANGNKQTTLVVDATTTISDLVTAYNKVGLSAAFDEKQQRIFIGAGTSGLEGKFTVTATQSSDEVVAARSDIRDYLAYDGLSSSDKEKVNNALLTLADPDKEEEEKEAAITTLQKIAEQNAKADATAALKAEYTAEETEKYLDADGNYISSSENDEALKSYGKMTDEKFDALTDEDKTALAKKMVEANVTEKMKTTEAKEEIETRVEDGASERETEIDDLVTAYADAEAAEGTAASSDILKVVGMSAITGAKVEEGTDATGMVVVAAQDAEVVINGATLFSSTNNMEVNGLSLELKNTTKANESISITVSNDTTAVYDMVKDFISEYNTLLKEMNTMYYAGTAKDYEPLTDEQKEEMSEDEIEKWEKKIKDSLLRRDDSLNDVINVMKSAMMGTVSIDGKNYSLSSLGIMTSTDYTEKGLLHIYGDSEDSVYADKENKLQQMIEEDPDMVMQILSGISTNLYSSMSKKMQASSLSSTMTFYNDKQMSSQLSTYKKEISEWEDKLKEIEDRYYSQFTAMEKALANLNSQQSAIAGYLG